MRPKVPFDGPRTLSVAQEEAVSAGLESHAAGGAKPRVRGPAKYPLSDHCRWPHAAAESRRRPLSVTCLKACCAFTRLVATVDSFVSRLPGCVSAAWLRQRSRHRKQPEDDRTTVRHRTSGSTIHCTPLTLSRLETIRALRGSRANIISPAPRPWLMVGQPAITAAGQVRARS